MCSSFPSRAAALSVAIFAAGALAAEPAGTTATDLTTPDPAWTVQAELKAWYVSPSGKVRLPVGSGTGPGGFTTRGNSVEVERLNLDTPRLEPAGEINLSAGRWRVTLGGGHYSLERDDTVADEAFRLGSVEVAPGDPLDVDYDYTSVELTAGYRIWGRVFSSPVFSQCPDNCVDSATRLYVIGGGRFTNFSIDVLRDTPVAASAGYDGFFGEPIFGIRGEVDLTGQFSFDVQVTGGALPLGDKSSYSFDIQTGFQWRPFANVGVQIGYRQLAFGLSDGDGTEEFEYNGRLAGLFAGLVIRF